MSLTSLTHSKEEQELSALMRNAQGGDRASYHVLLEKVQVLVKSFVTHSLAKTGRESNLDAANDIVQETLLGIHAKRHTYDPDRYFLPWMYAIARYKIIDYFRFRKTHAHTISLDIPGVLENIQTDDHNPTAAMDAGILLAVLPDKQQLLLKLVKLDGLSIYEASLKTGFSTSDVKVSLHRGLKTLQKKLKERVANE
jgi:RNA polymerase sigma-70 factor (ECF subfamily)